ncbi:ExeA family protein [Gemmatimonadota bacterium]
MYLENWGLDRMPFKNTPDPDFYYHSPQHEETLSRMLFCVQNDMGAALLTGVFGCGKTLAIHLLKSRLDKANYRFIVVSNPQLNDLELLRMILIKMGLTAVPENKADVVQLLEDALINNYRDGRETILIIDEAHIIEQKETFEEIRLLLNYQTEGKTLLSLFLVGQPELGLKVDLNKPLSQRLAMRAHLAPFTEENTTDYIRHRLTTAGAQKELFTQKAYELAHDLSGGIPRRINNICNLALLLGASRQLDEIDEMVIYDVSRTLEGEY